MSARAFRSFRFFFRDNKFGARAFVGSATLSLALAGGVMMPPVFAKSGNVETPEYLLPFYLRSLQARFNHFASVQSGGRKNMNSVDFVNAMIGSPTSRSVTSVPASLQQLFSDLDADGDGLLSFHEFAVLVSLVTASREEWSFAFNVFATGAGGTVCHPKLTHTDFKSMLPSVSVEPAAVKDASCYSSPLMHKFFGEKLDRCMTFEEFWNFIEDLRINVWQAEFNSHAENGKMGIACFFDVIAASQLGSHLPFHLVATRRRLEKMEKANAANSQLTEGQFLRLMHLISEKDHMLQMVTLFAKSGQPLTREVFLRAAKSAGHRCSSKVASKTDLHAKALESVSAADVAVLYALLDRDGDGTIDPEEYIVGVVSCDTLLLDVVLVFFFGVYFTMLTIRCSTFRASLHRVYVVRRHHIISRRRLISLESLSQ